VLVGAVRRLGVLENASSARLFWQARRVRQPHAHAVPAKNAAQYCGNQRMGWGKARWCRRRKASGVIVGGCGSGLGEQVPWNQTPGRRAVVYVAQAGSN